MSQARLNFFATMDAMVGLAAEPLLVDVFPPAAAHNVRARIIRSGLVVSALAHLEAFLTERFEELLAQLPRSTIRYSAFDGTLRHYLCVGAVQGLARKVSYMEDPDGLAFAEAHLQKLVGFNNTPPTYSSLGFLPKRTNISADDIQSLLKAFGIKKAWEKLGSLCTQLELHAFRLGATWQTSAMHATPLLTIAIRIFQLEIC